MIHLPNRVIVLFLFVLVTSSLPFQVSAASFFSDIQIVDSGFDLQKDNQTRISWRMSQTGRVTLLICDLGGRVVRILHDKQSFVAGPANTGWDGNDDSGKPCPDGAYIPILRATANDAYQVYNPTAKQWGGRLNVDNIRYDGQKIAFSLSQPAICLIRVGIGDGGPLYRTLEQWAPRSAGSHEEAWDGWDARGVVNVADNPGMKFIIDAIALPEDAILLTGSATPHSFKRDSSPRYHLHPASGKTIFMHSLHNRQFCRDIDIAITIDGKNDGEKNPPILNDSTSIIVDIPDRDHLSHLEREGFEIYAFMDGEFVTEFKVKTMPVQFNLKTETTSIGSHILTINARSTEDHVGTYSMAVRVAK